jgi:acyl carrier protein
MENFLEQMAELFEVDEVNLHDEVISFDAWDSLTGLSIIALADDEYEITITADDILEAKTIEGLYALFNKNK